MGEEDESARKVVDAAILVHRTLGPGLLESAYQLALAHELAIRGASVRRQVAHGAYPAAHIYGDGAAGPRIADILATTRLSVQKRIEY